MDSSGGVMSCLYLIIGMAFWGLVGFGVDWLLNTRWFVWVGVLIVLAEASTWYICIRAALNK